MPFQPKTVFELNDFLDTVVSPEDARSALSAIFVCLYGTNDERAAGGVSFATEKPWSDLVVCNVADELASIGLFCDQPDREED